MSPRLEHDTNDAYNHPGTAIGITVESPEVQLANAMREAGIEPPPNIVMDGKIHRFSSSGKQGDKNGWYIIFNDGILAGSFGCWQLGISQAWCADIGHQLTTYEHEANITSMAEAKALRDAEQKVRWAEAADEATEIWNAASPADPGHPYLTKKAIKPHGLRQEGDNLLVPIQDISGTRWSLQRISSNGGTKKFLPCGKIKGGFTTIRELDRTIYIAEGYATGATIHEVTGCGVVVAFSCHGLLPVSTAIRKKYPKATLIIAADNDQFSNVNLGVIKARAAALAVKAKLVIPKFTNKKKGHTDFNDLYQMEGGAVVKAQLQGIEPWSEPESLQMVSAGRTPYPLGDLPTEILAAVEEVRAFVKAPEAMVACSALSTLSLAAQGLADVQRAEKLVGPVSLFLLILADSGERKTTIDTFFNTPTHEYVDSQQESAKPKIAKYQVDMAAWEAKHTGIKEKIRQLAKNGEGSAKEEEQLLGLESSKPIKPRVPRMLYSDATPEALAHSLHSTWPSGGVISAEAGTIFGSHGMSSDSTMRNLSQLNVLWDGGNLVIDRRTSDSFTVKGARLTMGLQVQEAILREFFAKSGELARGSGFLARFLVAWPESTQGHRLFTDPPKHWPALTTFNERIASLLNIDLPINDTGQLTPNVMRLSDSAKALWVEFHDSIERKIGRGGEYHEVKDVAAKVADNAARLAGLFHVYKFGPSGPIGEATFKAASRIVLWHLHESMRFLGEFSVPAELAYPVKLNDWLVDYCRNHGVDKLTRQKVQQYVTPAALRKKSVLDEALTTLVDTGRIQTVTEGRHKDIYINPAMLNMDGA